MVHVFYLAWRYLAHHRFKTAVLVASITTIVYLPGGLNILVGEIADQLTARGTATPLLVGAKGSPLELVLNSLYFESDVPAAMRYAEVTRIEASGLARAIPLHTRFRTRSSPIVGTSLEYFEFRDLRCTAGRPMGMLGECVLGAHAAQAAGVRPGDSVMSRPENIFDLAGVYPLKMKVVGVLKPVGTPDDRAVFVDLKTAWVIEGLAHGHRNLRPPEADDAVLGQEGARVIANASVRQYDEITPDNVASFHFHGDPADFPVHAVIAVPHDVKSGTLLQGRYVGQKESVQMVAPGQVLDELLKMLFTARRYLLVAMALVAAATVATMTLVFTLSLQLRRREMETMIKIGGSPVRIAWLFAVEVLSVLAAAAVLASVLALFTSWLATSATRLLVQLG